MFPASEQDDEFGTRDSFELHRRRSPEPKIALNSIVQKVYPPGKWNRMFPLGSAAPLKFMAGISGRLSMARATRFSKPIPNSTPQSFTTNFAKRLRKYRIA